MDEADWQQAAFDLGGFVDEAALAAHLAGRPTR